MDNITFADLGEALAILFFALTCAAITKLIIGD